MSPCERTHHTYICKKANLRFDLPLWLAHETIRPLIQFTGGRLLYPNVAILVAPHLLGYILVYIQQKDSKN